MLVASTSLLTKTVFARNHDVPLLQPFPRARKGTLIFTVVFYGVPIFWCKTAGFCEVRCKLDLLGPL
jgi:hypothetical protein